MDLQRHQDEILENQRRWEAKPLLREVYRGFHEEIARELSGLDQPLVVELGSGIGNIREVIPHALRTDLFPNPWIDRTENAYALSFADGEASDLVLMDVFHHLRYPGTAMKELRRVLRPGGRLLIFEPNISLLGRLVYGPAHPEPIAWRDDIAWDAPEGWSPADTDYYAAQGNATRLFLRQRPPAHLDGWRILTLRRFAALSYVLTGGYAAPQLYPARLLPLMRRLDRLLGRFPGLFATRMLVVLEKL